jgi:hypothetical protein
MRAPVDDLLCGCCKAFIRKGAPIFVYELAGVKGRQREKVRCVTCAGPAPPDLPPLIELAPLPPPRMVRLIPGTPALPLDWKQRATAEREPGQEG